METNETVLKEIDIMQIGGFKVGHAENQEAGTGCTVLLFDKQSPAGVDVRGGGPASRETPLLNPVADCKGLHALLLSGGSAYALNAATGVISVWQSVRPSCRSSASRISLISDSAARMYARMKQWRTAPAKMPHTAPCRRATMVSAAAAPSAN